MGNTTKLNSTLNLSHLEQLIWDQTQTNTWAEQLEAHISSPAGQFMPPFSGIRATAFILMKRGDNAH